ncbi:MAG: dihydropyrimidine dehydrogenase, partial [Synergistaceae bacterium]|nr:dihydropyrimidine dehydrogenase [Synergistaceae bacterium]
MAVSKTKTPISEQPPAERVRNFREVCLGYTVAEGRAEAARCLQCKDAPCVAGCPVEVNIPAFIKAVRDGDMAKSAEIMAAYTNLPAVCGRVCPQETQCEGLCRLGRARD